MKPRTKNNIRAIFSLLVFLFGLGLMIFAETIEIKLFGLVYIAMVMSQ